MDIHEAQVNRLLADDSEGMVCAPGWLSCLSWLLARDARRYTQLAPTVATGAYNGESERGNDENG